MSPLRYGAQRLEKWERKTKCSLEWGDCLEASVTVTNKLLVLHREDNQIQVPEPVHLTSCVQGPLSTGFSPPHFSPKIVLAPFRGL